MSVDAPDVLAVAPEGDEPEIVEVELNPQGAPSDSEQTPQGTGPDAQAGGDKSAADNQADQTIPIARFREVEAKLKRFERLAPLADLAENDPAVIADVEATVLQRRLGGRPAPVQEPSPAPAAPATPAMTADELRAKIASDFERDPVSTIIGVATKIAQDVVKERTGQVPDLARQGAVSRFRTSHSRDQLFTNVEPAFQQVVDNIPAEMFSGKKQAEIDLMLETAYNAAVGVMARQTYARSAPKPDTPPSYGGGGTGPGGGGKRTVKVPREVLTWGRQQGLTDAEIAQDYARRRGEDD